MLALTPTPHRRTTLGLVGQRCGDGLDAISGGDDEVAICSEGTAKEVRITSVRTTSVRTTGLRSAGDESGEGRGEGGEERGRGAESREHTISEEHVDCVEVELHRRDGVGVQLHRLIGECGGRVGGDGGC